MYPYSSLKSSSSSLLVQIKIKPRFSMYSQTFLRITYQIPVMRSSISQSQNLPQACRTENFLAFHVLLLHSSLWTQTQD